MGKVIQNCRYLVVLILVQHLFHCLSFALQDHREGEVVSLSRMHWKKKKDGTRRRETELMFCGQHGSNNSLVLQNVLQWS